MNKEYVVSLMTNTITQINRQMGLESNIPKEELENVLKAHEEQLNIMNAKIYDALIEHGVINSFSQV
jgi:hypothetical protein